MRIYDVGHTSESLPGSECEPASLRRRAGGGRRVQDDGAASGVVRCRVDTSNGESRDDADDDGVFGGTGGPRDGGRLCGR